MIEFTKYLEPSAPLADIENAIIQAEQQIKQEERQKISLAEQRSSILVTGTDDDIGAIDDDLAKHGRSLERLAAGIAALRDAAEKAEMRDQRAELELSIKRAKLASEKGCELINRYGDLAREIREILLNLDAVNNLVENVNDRARRAGVEFDRVELPNRVMRSRESKDYEVQTERMKYTRVSYVNGQSDVRGERLPDMERKFIAAHQNPELETEVVLPGEDEAGNIWPIGKSFRDNERAQIDSRLEALGI